MSEYLNFQAERATSCLEVHLRHKVSRAFHKIIDGSLLLMYKIECSLAGVIDNPSSPVGLKARLDNPRSWRDVRKRAIALDPELVSRAYDVFLQ